MKVIVYSVPTVNSVIAMEDESNYDFISESAWKQYLKAVKDAKAYVMGGRTYEKSLESGAFPYDCLNVVMTHKKVENKWGDRVMFTSKSPMEIVEMLREKGFEKVIITGGHVCSSFMKDKLVDEIWIDLMPRVFGKGKRLFSDEDFDAELKLIKVAKSGDNEIQLRYKVVRYH